MQTKLNEIRKWNMWDGVFEGILVTYTGDKVIFIKGWISSEGEYETKRVDCCYLDELNPEKLDKVLTGLGIYDGIETEEFIPTEVAVDEELLNHIRAD